MGGLLVVACFLLCCGVHGTLYSINEEFMNLKNDLPMKTIEDVVAKQNEMIEVMAAYLDVNDRLPTETFDTSVKATLMPKNKLTYKRNAKEYLDIHNDVVFVGFPASAVDAVRSKWFLPLTHTDPLMASVGPQSNIVATPGGMNVRHHFHLVSISFHVADSLRDYVSRMLLHETEDGDGEHYINAWELEEVLESLSSAIGTTHTVHVEDGGNGPEQKSFGATDTLFVINLDVATTRGAEVRYTYRNGFSMGNLRAMAVEADVLRAAEEVLGVRRSTRMDFTADDSTPLFNFVTDPLTGKIRGMERTYKRSGEALNKQVHWRDAVSATRDWAKALGETIADLSKVRCCEIPCCGMPYRPVTDLLLPYCDVYSG
jgi:hypothetical protein